jgi:hypothetical protein
MTLFAHAVIEVPVDPEDATRGVTRYERGDVVPDDVPGAAELSEAGSLSDESYDPSVEVQPPPKIVEIEGIRYVQQESDDA